ncbi:MAG: sugar porter family MFS transporter [Bacteroidales bacterium]|jgi:MFS family permease|nr:sugar porter family MFS transporter [Bacteroidales bacterium]
MKKSIAFTYAFIAAFGALVVGLNMGGISGAIDIIEAEFSLDALTKGFVTGALMVGCLFGALLGGRLSDKYGRKLMLIISAVLLGLSAGGCGFLSHSASALVIYRFIGGLGVGVLSAVIPTYITEISPAELRGTFVSFYQLFVVVGILVAYCANLFFSSYEMNWHLMLGLPLAFAILDIVLLLFLPESPIWLEQRGQKREREKVAFKELFKGRMGYVVFLGSMLAFFQQITGINVVVNYAPSILGELGIAGNSPLVQTVYIGLANLLFTVIALWLVDKFGRKTLLVSGCFGCTAALAYMTYAYSIPDPSSIGVLIAILAYIGFFALSLSPLMFVVTSEIYPSHIRGTAMAVSTGISWACAFIVVQFYPWMESTLGANVAFGIFAFLCLAAGLFIQFLIPETKGKSLESIEKELKLR